MVIPLSFVKECLAIHSSVNATPSLYEWHHLPIGCLVTNVPEKFLTQKYIKYFLFLLLFVVVVVVVCLFCFVVIVVVVIVVCVCVCVCVCSDSF